MWEHLWCSAVTYLGVSPSEAWKLTPANFWMLWDAHLQKTQAQTGGAYVKPMSLSEFNELDGYLDSIHGNN